MLITHVDIQTPPPSLCLNGLILTDLFVSISHLLISKFSLTLPSPPRQAGFPAPLAMPCNSPAPNDHRVSPFSSLLRWLLWEGRGTILCNSSHPKPGRRPGREGPGQEAWEGPGQEVLGGTGQEVLGGTGQEA